MGDRMGKATAFVCVIALGMCLITTKVTGRGGKRTIATKPPSESSSSGSEVPRFVKVESSNSNSNVQPNSQCSCIYDQDNSLVKAQLGHRLLKRGDKIMLGEAVTFECKYFGRVLLWKNRFRFHGRATMTCSTCTRWQSDDLPTCNYTRRVHAVIGYDDDLKILSGGIVDLRKGDSHRFFCSNILRQPQWDYGDRKGVLVNKTQDEGRGNVMFVSYLDIKQAEDRHSGRYVCFMEGEYGGRVGSSILDLQVNARERYVPSTADPTLKCVTPTQEPSDSSPAITEKYTPEKYTSRTPSSWDVEGLFPANVDEENPVFTTYAPTELPEEECFCDYPVENGNIVAHADGKRLVYGDRVPHGSSIEFRCLLVGYDRFRGNRKITCSDCQPWHFRDFPVCTSPVRGDAVILLNKNRNILANGNIELYKGERVNFTCAALETVIYPEWNVPKAPGISFIRERRENEEYGDFVYFTHLQIQDASYAHEGTYTCSNQGKHETTMNIVLTDPALRCPEIPAKDRIIIKYEMERREGSKVSFSCSKKGQELIGKPHLTCLRSGEWSDPPPYCSGIRCEKLKMTYLLRIDYSDGREVGSLAAFHCTSPGIRTGSPYTWCLENGTWAHPAPVCRIPRCSLDELIPSLPEDVVLADDENEDSLSHNSAVKLACDNNKIIEGNPEAKCGKKGEWIIGPVQCELGCKAPRKSPGSRLKMSPEKDVYLLGDRLTFSCPPGMHLTTDSQVIMCLSSGWSETVLPNCKAK